MQTNEESRTVNRYRAIYEKSGQSGVCQAALDEGWERHWFYCNPCDSINPVHNGDCLVCGSRVESEAHQEYWRCKCEHNYIHPGKDDRCKLCNTWYDGHREIPPVDFIGCRFIPAGGELVPRPKPTITPQQSRINTLEKGLEGIIRGLDTLFRDIHVYNDRLGETLLKIDAARNHLKAVLSKEE